MASQQPVVTILYPVAGPDEKPFDFEYYVNNHMSKLQSQWPQYGLQSWQVVKMDASSGYSAMCLTYWKDTAGFTKAASVSAEIMADGPNYSATKPVLLVGSVLAASEK